MAILNEIIFMKENCCYKVILELGKGTIENLVVASTKTGGEGQDNYQLFCDF